MNMIFEQINMTGKAFVEFALAGLVQSSVLIVILLLVDLALRRKVRAVFRYWLWMLVLAKLVLPTSLSSPVSLGHWFGDKLQNIKIVRQTTAVNLQELQQPTELEPIEVGISTPPVISPPTEIIKPSVTAETAAESIIPARTVTPVTWQGVVFLVWLAVVGAMGLLLLQRAIFVRGLIAQAREANSLMKDAFEFCRKQMGVKRKVGLKVSANATSPAVCGIWCYVILLPRNLGRSLGSRDLRAVLLHELAHIKRGDLWVNFVQTVLQIVYFYNPLLWLANAIIRRVREQAVDEAVLVTMGEKAQWYPQTLVSVAKLAFKRPALSLRLIGVVESKSALTGRIKRILNRPIPKTAKLGILGLIAILVTAAVLLPMARVEKNEDANSLPKMTFDPPEMKLRAKRTYGIDEPIELYLSWTHNGWVQTADNRAPENEGKWILLLRVNGTDYRQGEYPILVPDHITAGVTRRGQHFDPSEAYSVDAKPKRIEFPPGKYRVSYVFKDVSAVRPDEPENVVHFGDIATNEVEFDVVDGDAGRSSKFKATLSNGVTVELLGVCEHPSEGKQWWRPNGTLLEEAPYDEVYTTALPAKSDQQAYEIAMRMSQAPASLSLSASGEVIEHSGYAVGHPRKDGVESPDIHVSLHYIPIAQTGTTIRLGPFDGYSVTFKNVSLRPGVRTDVGIEVEGAQKGSGVVASAGGKFESVEEFVAALVAGSQVSVENINGSIKVGGEETRECRIKATIEVKAKNENATRKLMEKVKVQVRQSGKRLSVRVQQPKLRRKQSVKVDFEITVPKKSNLDLHTNNGEIEIADISGEIESKTNNGAIEAVKIAGDTLLHTNNGKVNISKADLTPGAVTVKNGAINCEEISGNIQVQVNNGKVKVSYARTAPSVCNVSITTNNGDIDFTGPVNFSAAVEAETQIGSITTNLPLTVKGWIGKSASGTLGKGEGKLHLETHNGSIKIR